MKTPLKLLFGLCLALSVNLQLKAQLDDWTMLVDENPNITLRDIYVKGSKIMAVGTDLGVYDPFVLWSNDSGKTWDTTLYNNGLIFRSINFADDQVGIITSVKSYSCVLRTTDGGGTWRWQWCDLDSAFTGVNQVNFVDANNGYMAGWGKAMFDDGSLYKTTDAGISWSHVGGNMPNKPIEYMQFFDLDKGYVGSFLFGHSILRKTTDGGQSWTDITVMDSLGFTDAHFENFEEGVAITSSGVYSTDDAFETWTKLYELPRGTIGMSIRKVGDVIVVAGATSSLNGFVCYSVDNGQTWKIATNLPNCDQINKIRYFENYIYAVTGYGQVLRSVRIEEPTTTGTIEAEEKDILSIYPNPVGSGQTFTLKGLDLNKEDVQIRDLSGRFIEFDFIQSSIGAEVSITTQGSYILNIKGMEKQHMILVQ